MSRTLTVLTVTCLPWRSAWRTSLRTSWSSAARGFQKKRTRTLSETKARATEVGRPSRCASPCGLAAEAVVDPDVAGLVAVAPRAAFVAGLLLAAVGADSPALLASAASAAFAA